MSLSNSLSSLVDEMDNLFINDYEYEVIARHPEFTLIKGRHLGLYRYVEAVNQVELFILQVMKDENRNPVTTRFAMTVDGITVPPRLFEMPGRGTIYHELEARILHSGKPYNIHNLEVDLTILHPVK